MITNQNQKANLVAYLFYFITIILIISCEKKSLNPNEIDTPEESIFKKVPNLESRLSECIEYKNQLVIVGQNLLYILGIDQNLIEKTTMLPNLKGTIILSDIAFGEITQQNWIYITPLANPNLGSPDPRLHFNFNTLNIEGYSFPFLNTLGAINENQQMLVPVLKDSEMNFLLIDFKLAERPGYTIAELDTFKILSDENFSSDIIKIEANKDFFFVSSYSEIYIIESSGKKRQINFNISELGETVDLIQHNDDLYLKSQKNKIFKSSDNGNTWTYIITQQNDGYFNNIFVKDRLLTHSTSGIFEIDLSTGELIAQNSKGINGQITFLREFNNKLYVTVNSYSDTSSGLYFIDLDTYFTN